MKIRKVQLIRLLKNMMESYNAFINDESLERKADAWYDKLKYQNEQFVTTIMINWHGTKMPTAIDILKKCFELNTVREQEHSTNNLICEYSKYSHAWEEECDISKSLCHNNWNEPEKNNINLINIDLNGKIFMACWYHRIKIRSIFENNENSKLIVDGLLEYKIQTYNSDLYSLTKDLTTKLRIS